MNYLVFIIFLAVAVSCLLDVIQKLAILAAGIECSAEVVEFKEYRTRSMAGADNFKYRALLKYTDQYGQEHKALAPNMYEKWESEYLMGTTLTIRYNRRNPEKIVVDKRELVRPIVILIIVSILPILYMLANYYLLIRLFQSLW